MLDIDSMFLEAILGSSSLGKLVVPQARKRGQVRELGPGSFECVSPWEQAVVILSGEAKVAIDGFAPVQLKAGDTALFPPKTRALWSVSRKVRVLEGRQRVD